MELVASYPWPPLVKVDFSSGPMTEGGLMVNEKGQPSWLMNRIGLPSPSWPSPTTGYLI